MRWLVLGVGLFSVVSSAAAAEPCGGISLETGLVATGRPLPATEALSPADRECLRSIAHTLLGLGGLRTVTLAVRVSDGRRAAGEGPKVGAAYQSVLAAGGIRERRVSVVAPALDPGRGEGVAVAYSLRKARLPLARLEAASGDVRSGPAPERLAPTTRGATYPPGTHVATGASATAAIGLSDGSRVILSEGGLLRLDDLYLDEHLKRVVKLQLLEGRLEADVLRAREGARFEVATSRSVAGARGTRFRVTGGTDAPTRLETLTGRVELAALRGGPPLAVEAGQGVVVQADGTMGPVRPLLPAPRALRPLRGEAPADAHLRWTPVEGAVAYRVEIARDAELVYDVRTWQAAGPAAEVPGALPPGRWYWRAAATDEHGLVGRPTKVHAFTAGGEAAPP